MAKTRSVKKFIMGVMAGGLVVACLGVGGKLGFSLRENTLNNKLENAENNFDATIEENIGYEYERYIDEQRLYYNAQIMLGNMDADQYTERMNELQSDEAKLEYLKTNYPESYTSKVQPIQSEVIKLKRRVNNNDNLLTASTVAVFGGLTVSAFAAAAYLAPVAKFKDDELQK